MVLPNIGAIDYHRSRGQRLKSGLFYGNPLALNMDGVTVIENPGLVLAPLLRLA